VRAKFAPARDILRGEQRREREALKARQGRLYLRIISAIDFTGTARRRQEASRRALVATHKEQRRAFSEKYREAQKFKVVTGKEYYDKQITEVQSSRLKHLATLHRRHSEADRFADHERQHRETDREQARLVTERKIQNWTKGRRTSCAAQQQGSARKEESKGKGDDSLAAAFKKAQQKNQDRALSPESGRERNRRRS